MSKSVVIGFRVSTPDIKERLIKQAQREGVTLSELIRDFVYQGLVDRKQRPSP